MKGNSVTGDAAWETSSTTSSLLIGIDLNLRHVARHLERSASPQIATTAHRYGFASIKDQACAYVALSQGSARSGRKHLLDSASPAL
jgi:hypothetical protein